MAQKEEKRAFYSDLFQKLDANSDGTVSIQELKQYLTTHCKAEVSDREVAVSL